MAENVLAADQWPPPHRPRRTIAQPLEPLRSSPVDRRRGSTRGVVASVFAPGLTGEFPCTSPRAKARARHSATPTHCPGPNPCGPVSGLEAWAGRAAETNGHFPMRKADTRRAWVQLALAGDGGWGRIVTPPHSRRRHSWSAAKARMPWLLRGSSSRLDRNPWFGRAAAILATSEHPEPHPLLVTDLHTG